MVKGISSMQWSPAECKSTICDFLKLWLETARQANATKHEQHVALLGDPKVKNRSKSWCVAHEELASQRGCPAGLRVSQLASCSAWETMNRAFNAELPDNVAAPVIQAAQVCPMLRAVPEEMTLGGCWSARAVGFFALLLAKLHLHDFVLCFGYFTSRQHI
jgi:hypothetical protein